MKYRKWCYLIGLGVAVAAAAMHAMLPEPAVELVSLDWRYRHFSDVKPSKQLIHIDIDDVSLTKIGRWPWPRREQALLLRTLKELGAKYILLDIIYPEPQPPRLELAGTTDVFADQPRFQTIGAGAVRIVDDLELRDAIKSAGNVLLAIDYENENPPIRERRLRQKIRELLKRKLTLTDAELAKRLHIPLRQVQLISPGIRQRVLDELVGEEMSAHPEWITPGATGQRLAFEALVGKLLLRGEGLVDPAYEKILRTAIRRNRALALMSKHGMPALQPLPSYITEPDVVRPPIPLLADPAANVGYVVVQPDVDGVVRRMPLLQLFRGRLYKQLGFATACELLQVPDRNIVPRENCIELRDARLPGQSRPRTIRIPLDKRGNMLISWACADKPWTQSFEHIAAAKLGEIWLNYRAINDYRRQIRIAESMAVGWYLREQADDPPAARSAKAERWNHYVMLRHRADKLQDRIDYLSALRPNDPEIDKLIDELARLQQQLRPIYREARENLLFVAAQVLPLELLSYQPLLQQHGMDDELRRRVGARELFAALAAMRNAATLANPVPAYMRQILQARVQLRPRIEGKVCLVGSTATGAPDFTPTPVYKRAPGVIVHSNIINTILQGSFYKRLNIWAEIAVIVLLGAAVTYVTSRYGPVLSGMCMTALAAGAVLLNAAVLFGKMHIWAAMLTPTIALVLSWAMVTAYRQLTEEREKRRLGTALSQYTSPAVARRIVRSGEQVKLSGIIRDVSCYFSDLAGFTTISEQLGAERTVAVLNLYLGRMTDVLHRYDATLKYAGDGIFAFFGAPELQPDHALRACRAALESRRKLQELLAEQAGNDFPPLKMRIGINSGPAIVGNCGSEQKFDYTCIGDTVNTGARLEPANKLFGTTIMISETTYELAASEVIARPLGRLLVPGKRTGVGAHELLCLKANADPRTLELVQLFTEALELYLNRRWQKAAELFKRCLRMTPEDGPSLFYLHRCQRLLQSPPPEGWTGMVEVGVK